uniref:E3 ubiquitin-protein ligase MYLIP-A n=1 Tax=Schistocephalus solidus TaxID=70667 RepID=A0A0V0J2T6_SCHSO
MTRDATIHTRIFMDSFRQIVSTRAKYPPRITFQLVLLDGKKMQVCVDKRISGADVFDKICEGLHLAEESTYFGLSFAHARGGFLWIIMEQSIVKQLRHANPLTVWMRVKFVCSPNDLFLSKTSLKGDLSTSGLTLDLQAQLAALLSRAHDGPPSHANFLGLPLDECSTAHVEYFSKMQQTLLCLTPTEVQRLFLNLVFSNLHEKQRFYYRAQDVFYRPVRLGIGPQGVVILNTESSLLEDFSFARLTAIGTIQSVLTLFTSRADGSQRADHFKLPSRQHAENAFRYIRETSYFLRGEVLEVRNVFPETGTSILRRRMDLQGQPQPSLTQHQVCRLVRARVANEGAQSNTDRETRWPEQWHLTGASQSQKRRFMLFRWLQESRSDDYERLH